MYFCQHLRPLPWQFAALHRWLPRIPGSTLSNAGSPLAQYGSKFGSFASLPELSGLWSAPDPPIYRVPDIKTPPGWQFYHRSVFRLPAPADTHTYPLCVTGQEWPKTTHLVENRFDSFLTPYPYIPFKLLLSQHPLLYNFKTAFTLYMSVYQWYKCGYKCFIWFLIGEFTCKKAVRNVFNNLSPFSCAFSPAILSLLCFIITYILFFSIPL